MIGVVLILSILASTSLPLLFVPPDELDELLDDGAPTRVVVLRQPGSGFAVASVTLAICGIGFGLVPILFPVAAVFGVLAIVYGTLGRRKGRDARGLANEVVDDLDEIDRFCHSYYGTEILQTEGKVLWDQVVAGNFTEVGWDTPEVFNARVTAAWEGLCRRAPGERVLVSCHGGTVRVILAAIVGNPMASFRTDYAAISRVDVFVEEDGTLHGHIVSANETGHFDADRTTAGGPMRGAPDVSWPGRLRSITTPR